MLKSPRCKQVTSSGIVRYIIHSQRLCAFSTSGFHSDTVHLDREDAKEHQRDAGAPPASSENVAKDAMTRRLQALSSGDLTGSRKEDIEAAGFSEDLKNELLGRIASSKPSSRSQYPSAFAVSEAPPSAGQGSRDIAAAQPWLGTEDVSDAALRMLDDARRKIRVPVRQPGSVARPPTRVDTGRPSKSAGSSGSKAGSGARIANARDRTSTYAYLKDESLTPEEKDKMRKELKDRFLPGARPMPTTLQGLSSLANERIENAIARGQFKDLPSRGKQIERDYNASSPFLDTTEYFMNKIIQKQEIVPPWIERQQELAANASRFRSRLRSDWRRHAARMIASAGGSLDAQVRRAEQFAVAEAAHNPQPRRRQEELNTVDEQGHMRQISVASDLHPPAVEPSQAGVAPSATGMITPEHELKASPKEREEKDAKQSEPSIRAPGGDPGTLFRDPDWERTEQSYHAVALKDLNGLTRTYNLMAPALAQKPYFSLERELRACYSDVAPTLAREIKERALGRVRDPVSVSTKDQGVLGKISGDGHVGRIRDEDGDRQYGFRQLIRDVFGRRESARG